MFLLCRKPGNGGEPSFDNFSKVVKATRVLLPRYTANGGRNEYGACEKWR